MLLKFLLADRLLLLGNISNSITVTVRFLVRIGLGHHKSLKNQLLTELLLAVDTAGAAPNVGCKESSANLFHNKTEKRVWVEQKPFA